MARRVTGPGAKVHDADGGGVEGSVVGGGWGANVVVGGPGVGVTVGVSPQLAPTSAIPTAAIQNVYRRMNEALRIDRRRRTTRPARPSRNDDGTTGPFPRRNAGLSAPQGAR